MELKPERINAIVDFKSAFNRTLWNWNNVWEAANKEKIAFNRTLWNWNIDSIITFDADKTLLIVPYGIETKDRRNGNRKSGLLIVPYGIETQ